MRLKNFDAIFAPGEAEVAPQPPPSAENTDLGVARNEVETVSGSSDHIPSSMTLEQFQEKYPQVTVSVTLNVGQNVTCHIVESKVFLTTASKLLIAGLDATNPKPLFLYAGGSWISDAAKASEPMRFSFVLSNLDLGFDLEARDFMSKPANENKAVEFRLENADASVITAKPSNFYFYFYLCSLL